MAKPSNVIDAAMLFEIRGAVARTDAAPTAESARNRFNRKVRSALAPPPCAETIAKCEWALRLALAGELTGLAFAAQRRGVGYVVDVTGEFRRNPTYGRGAVASLDDWLRDLVHERST
jgi:hypothetical protein